MQTVLTYVMLLLTGIMLQAQNQVEVSIHKLKSNDGKIMVGIYNQEDTWLNTPWKSYATEISDMKAAVTIPELPDGIYAISLFHDEDSNGKLNMTMGLIPSEPYGCSNGAKGFFGPPKWEDAKFELKNGELRKMDINL